MVAGFTTPLDSEVRAALRTSAGHADLLRAYRTATRELFERHGQPFVDGVDHFVLRVDISAFTHPFYTGKQKILDTEGRVERFRKRYAKKGKK